MLPLQEQGLTNANGVCSDRQILHSLASAIYKKLLLKKSSDL